MFLPNALLAIAVAASEPGGALALRGGVLLLPLRSQPANPTAAHLINSNNNTPLETRRLWISREVPVERRWSLPAVRTCVSDSPTSQATAYLAVLLPEDGEGDLAVGDAVIPLRWEALPAQMPPLRLAPADHPGASGPWASLPLDDPSQAWRCELAASLGLAAIDQARFDGTPSAFVAQAAVGPWRLALHRVHADDPGVARQVAELLTGIVCMDPAPIAGWYSRADMLVELLNITMEDGLPDDPLAARVLRWCERQAPLLAWIDSTRGPEAVLSLANPASSNTLAEIAWVREGEIPLASLVPPRTLIRAVQPAADDLGRTPLLVEVGVNHLLLPVNREPVLVEPPGTVLGPLLPPLCLADVAAGRPPTDRSPALQTHAHLRRLQGRWELLIECRTPDALETDLKGETVVATVVCGDEAHEVTVTPAGVANTVSVRDESPTAFVRVTDDAWRCRLQLPDHWVSCGQPRIGLWRRHHGTLNIDTWPTACAPWNPLFDPAPFDLRNWDGDRDQAAGPPLLGQ